MRIALIGNSGSGKSRLSRQLASAHALPMLDLDTVAWERGKVAVARAPDAAVRDVQAFCEASESWVVEGCYAGLVRAALAYSPVLLFIEPGVEACVANWSTTRARATSRSLRTKRCSTSIPGRSTSSRHAATRRS